MDNYILEIIPISIAGIVFSLKDVMPMPFFFGKILAKWKIA
jgi:hypothetical protein